MHFYVNQNYIDRFVYWLAYENIIYSFVVQFLDVPSRSKDKVNQARDENQCINLQKGFIQMAMPLDNTLAIYA